MLVTFNHKEQFQVDSYQDLQALYPKITGVRFNHVISALGRTESSDNATSQIDRLALHAIRANSDLIVTSGKTARAENLKASKFADMLVITNDASIDFPALQSLSAHQILVTVDNLVSQNSNAKAVGSTGDSIAVWFQQTIMPDYKSIVIETGLWLAKEFAEAQMFDEVCLTITHCPKEHAAANLANQLLTELQLNGVLVQTLTFETNYLFRFKVQK